jgi:hypothetical protein
MGAGTSAPKIDYSTAQFSSADVSRQISAAASKTSESVWGYAKTGFWILGLLLVFGAIGTGLYYYFTIEPELQATLVIDAAILQNPKVYGASGINIADQLRSSVKGDALHIAKGAMLQYNISGYTCPLAGGTGASGPCPTNPTAADMLSLTYHFSGTTKGLDTSTKNPVAFPITDSIDIDASYEKIEAFTNKRTKPPVAKNAGPTLLGRLGSIFNTTGSSADLLPYAKEARTEALIPSASAPLSGGQDGAYGMQFWMYVQDWNYKYGVEKHVVSRGDPTNPAIMNPSISLHPTDNTLNISVSVFGSSSSSKTEPAPYGHSGATDDVFICEVPDIPLQTWCSVSVTLFSRNLDVYLNGKLVKSCVLSGVPKPVAGDIYLNSGGGFSGYLCSYYHYPRMLTPDDASAFYSQGTSCTTVTDPSVATKTTGYGFKFGIYDAAGKQLSQYVL